MGTRLHTFAACKCLSHDCGVFRRELSLTYRVVYEIASASTMICVMSATQSERTGTRAASIDLRKFYKRRIGSWKTWFMPIDPPALLLE